MANLSRKTKVQCQVIFGMLVPAMLLQNHAKEQGLPTDNAAVKACIAMIDELFATHGEDTDTINAMNRRINAHRVKFTKKVQDVNTVDGVIGAMLCLSRGIIKTKAGTRLDWIIQNFTQNLGHMQRVLDHDPEQAYLFAEKLKQAIIGVG